MKESLKRGPLFLHAVFVLVCAPLHLNAQSFDWSFKMETGFRTSGVASGDFDNDGDPDLVFAVGEHWPHPTLVFFNEGHGNYKPIQTLPLRDQKGQAVGVNDVNGDGWLDVVLVTEQGDLNPVFLNDGTGRFIATTRLGEIIDNGRDLAFADLDQDGRDDVIFVNRGQPNRVFRNVGGEDQFVHWFDFGSENGATVSVVAAPIDADAFPDIAVADWSGESRGIHVYLNDGTGHVGPGHWYGHKSEAPSDLAASDLDGDGDVDLVVAVQQRNPARPDAAGFEYDLWEAGGRDYILLNNGQGRFAEPVPVGKEGDSTLSVCVADFNLDGLPDLAFTYSRGESFYRYDSYDSEYWFDRIVPGYYGSVLKNDGNGVFETVSEFNASLESAHDMVAVDVNQDGYPDLVLTDWDAMSSVFLNSLGPEVGKWR